MLTSCSGAGISAAHLFGAMRFSRLGPGFGDHRGRPGPGYPVRHAPTPPGGGVAYMKGYQSLCPESWVARAKDADRGRITNSSFKWLRRRRQEVCPCLPRQARARSSPANEHHAPVPFHATPWHKTAAHNSKQPVSSLKQQCMGCEPSPAGNPLQNPQDAKQGASYASGRIWSRKAVASLKSPTSARRAVAGRGCRRRRRRTLCANVGETLANLEIREGGERRTH